MCDDICYSDVACDDKTYIGYAVLYKVGVGKGGWRDDCNHT